jgi:Domain of Unknown Function (DUF1206)
VGVRRASREAADRPWVERALRAGVAVRGVVFLVLAYLLARIASGALGGSSTKASASGSGVAQAIAAQPGGTVMVFLLGVGLACYAVFSALDTILHSDGDSEAKRWGERIHGAFRTTVYAAFSVYAFYTAFNPQSRSGTSKHQSKEQTHWSAKVLSWPAGWLWLGALGLGLLIGAVVLAVWAVRRSFLDDLEKQRMGSRAMAVATGTGVAGYLGRAALYASVGWFISEAAIKNNPKDSQGVDGSVRTFADNGVGAAFLYIIAAALVAFAIYMFLEARYRKV